MEIWDLYTKERIKTDKKMIRGEKQPEDLYRMVVHLCIFNKKGEMLIQKRQEDKKLWPNLWDITVGGSTIEGENSQDAIQRELKEELGIDYSFANIRPCITVNFKGGFDDIYVIEKDIDIKKLVLQKEEVSDVMWADREKIITMIDGKSFIPYYKSLIKYLFDMKNNNGYGMHSVHTN